MHGGVINENASLLHHLLHMSQAQRIGNVPAYACEHDFQRVVQPFEDLAQSTGDETLAEIKHGPDCRLGLLRQNHAARHPHASDAAGIHLVPFPDLVSAPATVPFYADHDHPDLMDSLFLAVYICRSDPKIELASTVGSK